MCDIIITIGLSISVVIFYQYYPMITLLWTVYISPCLSPGPRSLYTDRGAEGGDHTERAPHQKPAGRDTETKGQH